MYFLGSKKIPYNLISKMTPLSEAEMVYPAHFMKQFHPECARRDKVEKRAQSEGVQWAELL